MSTKTIKKGYTIPVHEHGFVRYIDHMGTDVDVVEAARICYHSPSKGEEADRKLLRYLFRNKHTSPFEMIKVKFNIKLPIFVMRQFVRHRMQNLNEVSARYTELPNEFFIPETWRRQDIKNKQGSVAPEGPLELKEYLTATDIDGSTHRTKDPSLLVNGLYGTAFAGYQRLLEAGVAREQARIVLPVGIYTEIYSCWDLNNLLKYFFLRDDPHAQGEHQDIAKAMKEITAELFPWTMKIYEEVREEQEQIKQIVQDAKDVGMTLKDAAKAMKLICAAAAGGLGLASLEEGLEMAVKQKYGEGPSESSYRGP